MGNFYVLTVSGLGVGTQGEEQDSANTLAHIYRQTGCRLPNLKKMGLANILSFASIPKEAEPLCAYGKVQKASGSSDIMAAYWEMVGISLEQPLPTYSKELSKHNLVTQLQQADVKTYAIGDLLNFFGKQNFTQYRESRSNAEGISHLLSLMSAASNSFVFVSLSDTQPDYGQSFDAAKFALSLQELDRAIPAIVSKLTDEDVLIITGDCGDDPISRSTNVRQLVPLLLFPSLKAPQHNLDIRKSLSDIACSAADFFGIEVEYPGQSFLTDSKS